MDVGSAWANYVKRLGKLDTEATKKVGEYIGSIPGFSFTNPEDMNKLVAYAYGISAKYGEGAAALACEMYDAIGIASGQILPPAEPADIPDMDEVAKAVRGTAKTRNPDNVSRSIGRLIKRTGADTTLKNAIRDGAEFAWIPNGDSCAFCITLASRGWQTASAKALKNGHAEHIHSNCDCTYGVRFNGKPTYKNYNPDEYLDQYKAAEGENSKDKINTLRRIKYQENKDRINAQKRAAYAERSLRTKSGGDYGVNWSVVKSKEYSNRFEALSENDKANALAAQRARNALVNRNGKKTEEIYAISLTTGKDISKIIDQNHDFGVKRTEKFIKDIERAEKNKEKVLLIHNHPGGSPPSIQDINELLSHSLTTGITVGHDGSLYYYTKPNKEITEFDIKVATRKAKVYNDAKLKQLAVLEELQKTFGFIVKEL